MSGRWHILIAGLKYQLISGVGVSQAGYQRVYESTHAYAGWINAWKGSIFREGGFAPSRENQHPHFPREFSCVQERLIGDASGVPRWRGSLGLSETRIPWITSRIRATHGDARWISMMPTARRFLQPGLRDYRITGSGSPVYRALRSWHTYRSHLICRHYTPLPMRVRNDGRRHFFSEIEYVRIHKNL